PPPNKPPAPCRPADDRSGRGPCEGVGKGPAPWPRCERAGRPRVPSDSSGPEGRSRASPRTARTGALPRASENWVDGGVAVSRTVSAQPFDIDAAVAARSLRAPRGAALNCKGWLQEAAFRMFCNNLDPEVAEKPAELIVYGGIGKAARNWEAARAI